MRNNVKSEREGPGIFFVNVICASSVCIPSTVSLPMARSHDALPRGQLPLSLLLTRSHRDRPQDGLVSRWRRICTVLSWHFVPTVCRSRKCLTHDNIYPKISTSRLVQSRGVLGFGGVFVASIFAQTLSMTSTGFNAMVDSLWSGIVEVSNISNCR